MANRSKYYLEQWLQRRKRGVNKGSIIFQGFAQVKKLRDQDSLDPALRHNLEHLDQFVTRYHAKNVPGTKL